MAFRTVDRKAGFGVDRRVSEALLNILFEDADLLVVNKPADLVCHPSKTGPLSSLIGRLRLYLGEGATPHLINRLDRETSGVVVVAKNLDAARELRRTWENREVRKTYWAVVHGWPEKTEGVIDAPIGDDEQSEVTIKGRVREDGAPSATAYRELRRWTRSEGPFALLEVQPSTGRKHQIRIHLSHIGHPVVGDKLYGGDEHLYLDFVKKRLNDAQRRILMLANQALHAREAQLVFRGQEWRFTAEPEAEFAGFCASAEPLLLPHA
jgi:23S rRNA pseudouridine1911/1915/1917 synthase